MPLDTDKVKATLEKKEAIAESIKEEVKKATEPAKELVEKTTAPAAETVEETTDDVEEAVEDTVKAASTKDVEPDKTVPRHPDHDKIQKALDEEDWKELSQYADSEPFRQDNVTNEEVLQQVKKLAPWGNPISAKLLRCLVDRKL